MKGAEYVLKCLEAEGIDLVFGYPGGAVIPLFDALYDNKSIRVIRTAHEQGASHAADGYARKTGKIGVCIATSGPGATNTVTGIATAYSDSSPLLVITGQVGSSLLGKNSFQEVDMIGITKPITKRNFEVTNISQLKNAMQNAFYELNNGRRGPVVIDITKDVFETEISDGYESLKKSEDLRHNKYLNEIKTAVDMIKKAKRPIIYAGGGVINSKASEKLTKLAKMTNIPVANTIMGLGSFDRSDKLSYGIVGMHGEKETNLRIYNSDLVVGVGVRFSDRAIGNRYGFTTGKIIHIDIDEKEFNKNVDTEITIAGDFSKIFDILIEELKDVSFPDEKREVNDEVFLPKRVIECLKENFPENTTVVTDVGQHQMWTMMYWKAQHERSVITSGGMGTMGFGTGAALGAKLADKNSPVLLITGDGSFRMNHPELLTMKSYNIPVTIVVFSNNALGMVRQWQGRFKNERYSHTDIYDTLNLENLAKAYGINYKGSFKNLEELKLLLNNTDIENDINLIEFNLDHDLGAFPMVAAGQSINNIIER